MMSRAPLAEDGVPGRTPLAASFAAAKWRRSASTSCSMPRTVGGVASTQPLYIANSIATFGNFNGRVDEVRVLGTALSAAAVGSDFENGYGALPNAEYSTDGGQTWRLTTRQTTPNPYINFTPSTNGTGQLVTLSGTGFDFNQIICIARGGLRVGDVLSRIFELPLAILSTHSYAADGGTTQGELIIAEHMTMTSPRLGERVLLVDDMVDSGHTLAAVAKALPERWPVLGPLTGAGLAFCWTAAGVTERDWGAVTVFLVPAAVLGAVAYRNWRVVGRRTNAPE